VLIIVIKSMMIDNQHLLKMSQLRGISFWSF
jgi:hypothetical protein